MPVRVLFSREGGGDDAEDVICERLIAEGIHVRVMGNLHNKYAILGPVAGRRGARFVFGFVVGWPPRGTGRSEAKGHRAPARLTLWRILGGGSGRGTRFLTQGPSWLPSVEISAAWPR